MFSKLPRGEEAWRLFAMLLIVGISREETTCPQVGKDEVVLNYSSTNSKLYDGTVGGQIYMMPVFCFFFSAKTHSMIENNQKHL